MNKALTIKKTRHMLGLTQFEFAKMMGLDGSRDNMARTVRKWEAGDAEPSGGAMLLAGRLLAEQVHLPAIADIIRDAVARTGELPAHIPVNLRGDLPPVMEDALRASLSLIEACGVTVTFTKN